jgi:hypothetical protein
MSEELDLISLCPVWQVPCIREKCVSYEVHSKERFKNLKTGAYIPLDQLNFYSSMSPEQIEETIERTVTIVRECKKFGKIIQIEQYSDHLLPVQE